jgi:hypothetical protein
VPLPAAIRSADDRDMKKAVAVVAVVIGLAALGRRLSHNMQPFDWEKAFDRLPDNSPPKWMFRNISAIRQNTERVLDLLERERADRSEPAKGAPDE